MKRTIPLLITSIGGFILVASAFIPAAQGAGETVTMWFNILAAIAMVLGGANLAQVQLKIISDRKPGWGYAAIVLLSFMVTLVIGLGKFGVRPDTSSQFPGEVWEPVPLEVFPTATLDLTAREQSVLGPILDRLRLNPPDSVASQIQFNDDSLAFRGWMNGEQVRELIDADDDVLWKSAAERLGEAAAVPDWLEGHVVHRGDRGVLGLIGTADETTETSLRSLLDGPPTERLVEASRRETTSRAGAIPPQMPSGVTVAGPLVSLTPMNETVELLPGVSLANARITVQGALTPAAKATLTATHVLSRPRNGLTADQANSLADEWELSGAARDRFVDSMTAPIDTAAIFLAIEAASEPVKSPRSWTAIANDVEAGNPAPPLETTSEAEPDLADEQRAAIVAFATSHADELEPSVLESMGTRQRAAFVNVLHSLPSNAVRQRDVAYELLAENVINRSTAEQMLEDYRIERGVERAIDVLYVRSQQQKFAYAADYAKNGSAFWWIYEYLFKPLTATMFSMLAFYISSAAFRAFRAKNLEAGLLLGTAFIVLLGRTFAGVWLTSWLPESLAFLKIENLTVFIMSVFNTAGNRAIMIGIALGIISTSLKVLLGMDRSYLGKE